jgi:hypothetical protein
MSAFIRVDSCVECTDCVNDIKTKTLQWLCGFKCKTEGGHDFPWSNPDGSYNLSKVTPLEITLLGENPTIEIPEWCPRRK